MDATKSRRRVETPAGRRRFGYVVAAVVNGVMLWIVNQLLGWGWPPFLTPDFSELLPWVNASFVASIVVNLIWAVRDPEWFKHLAQAGLNIIGLVVAILTWQIFPFDFAASAWETAARIVIGVAIVAMVASTIVELVKLPISVAINAPGSPGRDDDVAARR